MRDRPLSYVVMAGVPKGFTLIETLFALGVMATIAAIAIPQIGATLDDVQARGAVRYVAARLQRARLDAIVRSTNVALTIVRQGGLVRYAVYEDGNGNGVLSDDIVQGIDVQTQPPEGIGDQFPGVSFGVLPNLPAPDTSGTAPGDDPIHLGSGEMASFSALGTSSSGSLYIRGRRGSQYVIRLFGETGRVRIQRFNAASRTWAVLP